MAATIRKPLVTLSGLVQNLPAADVLSNNFLLQGAMGDATSNNHRYRSVMPASPTIATLTLNTVYWVYIGQTLVPCTVNFATFYLAAAGAGADNGTQIGVASTPSVPSGAGSAQTCTVLGVSAVSTSLTATGTKASSALGVSVAAGVALWAFLKSNMATTQLGVFPVFGDTFTQVLALTGAGTLVAATGYTGTAQATSAAMGPDMALAIST